MVNEIFNYSNWPWGEASEKFSEYYLGKREWPKVTVIIPSFNQGSFIEETILSVINQNYPNLELIIIDGGSQDNTLDIILKYKKNISYWVSEKDRGQSHAINKGLEIATGDWIAWLNSDDCYLKNAFHYLFNEANIEPYEFVYGDYLVGPSLTKNRLVTVMDSRKLDHSKVIRFFFGVEYIIPSQSVFVRKELVEKVGFANESLHYVMDADWYVRILKLNPKVKKYDKVICFFRLNEKTKTGSLMKVDFSDNKMGQEAEMMALKYSKELNFIDRVNFDWLYDYYLMYSKEPEKYDNASLLYLLKILIKHPFKSISDRRMLGLFKRKLVGSILKKIN
jgi:glycosyltransferase involved in cell wall biosynthesis